MDELTRQKRDHQRMIETIIETAENFFCKQGYENTSMDDIAKASEYTKRTIYKYFTNKEDLFFAVALKGYHQLIDMLNNNNKEISGFDKIRSSYYSYYEFYRQYPQLLQLINTSSMIKTSSANSETPYRQEFLEVDRHLFENLFQLFLTGREDGSIRTDVELPMLAFSSVFTAAGFFQMLALSGDTYTKHFGMDKDLFIKFSIDMMLDTMRNKAEKFD